MHVRELLVTTMPHMQLAARSFVLRPTVFASIRTMLCTLPESLPSMPLDRKVAYTVQLCADGPPPRLTWHAVTSQMGVLELLVSLARDGSAATCTLVRDLRLLHAALCVCLTDR